MNFQPPEYDDPRDEEDRMNDGIRAALADKLGFSIEERGGCPVIVEDGEAKPADLEHRVLWDEVVSLTAEADSLRAVNAELLEALERALPLMEAEAVINGYGYYRPANPNDFHPDHESCSEDEIAAHKAACEAYDAGTYNDNYGGGWAGPGLHILKAPWGIGSYTDTIPELEAQCQKARAAIASARKQDNHHG